MLVGIRPQISDYSTKPMFDLNRRIDAHFGNYKRIGKQSLGGYNNAKRLIGKIKLANQLLG
jgi:hypothetical protein